MRPKDKHGEKTLAAANRKYAKKDKDKKSKASKPKGKK
jgi:hypothetical protein